MGIINSTPREEDEDDCTLPYVGRKFYSSTGAKKFYGKYASDFGFIVRKEKGKWYKTTGKRRARTFVCDSKGCQAKMCIAMDDSVGMHRVFLFIKDHDHPVNPKQEVSVSRTTEICFYVNKPGTVYEYMRKNQALVYKYMRQNQDLPRNEADMVKKSGEQQSIEILSWEPRAFLYHSFLSEEECKHLIDLAKAHMTRSCLVDEKTGRAIVSSSRTCFGMVLKIGHSKIVSEIEERIAEFTCVPKENGEGLAVLRYEIGQKVVAHHDYLVTRHAVHNGGQRIATFLMYLSDVEEGGETIFPSAKEMNNSVKKSLAVKPKLGDALLFWSLKPDGTLDSSSLHESSPVIRGTKWSCTKFLHVGKRLNQVNAGVSKRH